MADVLPEPRPRNMHDPSHTVDAARHGTDSGQGHWFYSGQRWRTYLRDMLARQAPSEGQERT